MVWKWVRWLLPSPTPRLEEHVSVWSIRRNDAGTFFIIVGALWLVGLARISYKAMEQSDTPLAGWASVDIALVIWGEFGTAAVGAAAMASTASALQRPWAAMACKGRQPMGQGGLVDWAASVSDEGACLSALAVAAAMF